MLSFVPKQDLMGYYCLGGFVGWVGRVGWLGVFVELVGWVDLLGGFLGWIIWVNLGQFVRYTTHYTSCKVLLGSFIHRSVDG